MSVDRGSESTFEAKGAMRQYYSTRPAPADTKAWFDENFPEARRPVLVAQLEGINAIVDIIKRHDKPLPRAEILRILGEECGLPGWLFNDGSAICINIDEPELVWAPGDRKATRIATPQAVFESTPMVEALVARLSAEDIRKAAVGPYREHLYLLLESPNARVREHTIAVLGETRRETDTGK